MTASYDKAMTSIEFKNLLSEMSESLWKTAAALMPSPEEAQDVVADTVEKLWSQRKRLKEVENVHGYVVTAVRRTALDALRYRARHPQADIDNVALPVSDRVLDGTSDLELVRKLMCKLPDNQRLVLEMTAFQQLEVNEICQRTGLSCSNVRVLLSRARKKLREDFAQYK